jgi:hypothetical protein
MGQSSISNSSTRLSLIQRSSVASVTTKSTSEPHRPKRRASRKPNAQLRISPSEFAMLSPW